MSVKVLSVRCCLLLVPTYLPPSTNPAHELVCSGSAAAAPAVPSAVVAVVPRRPLHHSISLTATPLRHRSDCSPSAVTGHQYPTVGGQTGLPPPYMTSRRPNEGAIPPPPHSGGRAGTIGPTAGATGPVASALAQIREGQGNTPMTPHQLASSGREEEIKPRSLRFTWSMKTTSSLAPDDMMRLAPGYQYSTISCLQYCMFCDLCRSYPCSGM